MNETFEEKVSFRMSRLNVFVTVGMTAIALIVGTMMLIAFTSLREFIPGYTKDKIVEMAYNNQIKIDSLEAMVSAQEKFLLAMNLAISGEIPIQQVEDIRDSIIVQDFSNIVYTRSREDDILREQVQQAARFNLAQHPRSASSVTPEDNMEDIARVRTAFNRRSSTKPLFFVPLEGTIIADFDAANKHFGIDITGKKNDVIKAVQSGTVVTSNWTVEGGYIIAIQHENNMLSVYKHNSAVLKRVGDYVRAGEPIAFIGSSGEGYKGPILHFELWYKGAPVNPRDYIAF